MGNCVSAKGPKKDPKRLTEEEIKLLLDNTRLTRPQIIALHQNFLKECPTGKLTKKDFIKLFKEVHPSENKKEKADKFCEYVFKVIDQQNLGYITFQEFVLCFSLTSDGEFKDKCEFAFKLYDLDKDGKISKKEMTQVLEALYDLSGITDRKGDKSPAKKVDDIIKAINAKSALAALEAAPAVSVSAPSKESNEIQLQVSAPEVSAPSSCSIVVTAQNPVIEAPIVTVSTSSPSDKKEAEKKAKEDKKAKKEAAPKVKLTKEEKAAQKEREKQEKERLKQEKEREKKEKAERAKLEKEQKEREKKEKAELKKLDKTVKADKSSSAAAKPAKAPKPAKEPKQKAAKPAKAEKIEYITKDQFIEACSTDEVLRQLFVDSIFCANPDATIAATLGENLVAKASEVVSSAVAGLPSISADLSATTPSIKTSKIVTTTTTIVSNTNNNNNETTTTTVEQVKTEESQAAEPKSESNESKPQASLEEIIDDIKNQIQNNETLNAKVEITSS